MMPKKQPKVAIITTTYNQEERLNELLESIYKKISYKNYKVFFGDDSPDGKIGKIIKKKFPKVDVTINRKNLGYSVANNILIRKALGKYNADYILHLDDDTRIIEKNWLKKMVGFGERNKEVGIFGCKVVYPDGRLQWFYKNGKMRFIPGNKKEVETRDTFETREVDNVIGACLMMKKEVLNQVGLFDEKFSPAYGEETDLCFRARKNGFKLSYYGDIKVVHHGSSSSKTLFKERVWFIKKRNAIRFELLNLSLPKIIKYNIIHLGSAFMGGNILKKLNLLGKAYKENIKNAMEIKQKRIERGSRNKHAKIDNGQVKISVVMTVFNGEKFLKKTIESVLTQSFKDFELIIVNDGSTDNTEKIIKSFNDKRIVYIKRNKNKGIEYLFEPINDGLKKAKGKYIARIDADDIMYPDRLEFQYNYLESHPKIFLLGGSCDIIDKEGNKIGQIIKKELHPKILRLRIGFSNPLIHSTIMFRNEKIIYPSRHEHLFYYYLMFIGKKLINTSKKLSQYRINPDGLMSKDADLSKNKYRDLYLKK